MLNTEGINIKKTYSISLDVSVMEKFKKVCREKDVSYSSSVEESLVVSMGSLGIEKELIEKNFALLSDEVLKLSKVVDSVKQSLFLESEQEKPISGQFDIGSEF